MDKITPTRKNIFAWLFGFLALTTATVFPFQTQAYAGISTAIGAVTALDQASTPVPTNDRFLRGKEIAWDAIAWAAVNWVIEEMWNDTVDWINGGMNGKPQFATNPQILFNEVGDAIFGKFLDELGAGFLCQPFDLRVRSSLEAEYHNRIRNTGTRPSTSNQCTWTGTMDNLERIMAGNMGTGGWLDYFSFIQGSNNPTGAYLNAESDLVNKIAQGLDIQKTELDWADGFLNKRTCVDMGPEGCVQWETLTPGRVLETQLNKTLGLEHDRLSVADEFNEALSALTNLLLNRVFGGDGIFTRNANAATPRGNRAGDAGQLGRECSPSLTTTEVYSNVTWSTSFVAVTGHSFEYEWREGNTILGITDTPSFSLFYDQPGVKSMTVLIRYKVDIRDPSATAPDENGLYPMVAEARSAEVGCEPTVRVTASSLAAVCELETSKEIYPIWLPSGSDRDQRANEIFAAYLVGARSTSFFNGGLGPNTTFVEHIISWKVTIAGGSGTLSSISVIREPNMWIMSPAPAIITGNNPILTLSAAANTVPTTSFKVVSITSAETIGGAAPAKRTPDNRPSLGESKKVNIRVVDADLNISSVTVDCEAVNVR